jgi:hypothetical protein
MQGSVSIASGLRVSPEAETDLVDASVIGHPKAINFTINARSASDRASFSVIAEHCQSPLGFFTPTGAALTRERADGSMHALEVPVAPGFRFHRLRCLALGGDVHIDATAHTVREHVVAASGFNVR